MTTQPQVDSSRRAAVATRLAEVECEIALASASAQRQRDDVTLIAITKTWPASDVRVLADLGVTEIGENKAQELAAKASDCADLPVRWHFVGQLQRNKAKVVATHAHMVHSIDRPELVVALNRQVGELGRDPLTCLIQVNLDPNPEPGRGGAHPEVVADLADLVAESESLSLGGVMGVASQLQEASKSFDALAMSAQEVRGRHASATIISAGMSGDYAAAIAAGATHIRLGAALLGQRSNLR